MSTVRSLERALVTGGSGFVGGWLVRALRDRGVDVAVADRHGAGALPLDLADLAGVRELIARTQPDTVFHLAAQAFIPRSIEDPLETFDTNARGTALLLEAVRAHREAGGGDPRVIVVSSSDVYGTRPPEDFPLRETLDLRPQNPYAASKVAAEAMTLAAHRTYGIDAIVTRAFNHIGPHQSDRFVVASFAAQLAAIARGGSPILLTGDLTARRDFLDVRDVAAAYIALAERGRPGEVYNVCGGRAVAISEVLRLLVMTAHVAVEIREDESRKRRVDVPLSVGDPSKLKRETGWEPRIPLALTLQETYRAALDALPA